MKKLLLTYLILSSITTICALQPRNLRQTPQAQQNFIQVFLNQLTLFECSPEFYTADLRPQFRRDWETIRNQLNQPRQTIINTRVRRLATTAAQILGS